MEQEEFLQLARVITNLNLYLQTGPFLAVMATSILLLLSYVPLRPQQDFGTFSNSSLDSAVTAGDGVELRQRLSPTIFLRDDATA